MSVDIRAAAACLRERYGVSSVVLWGTCYGGGRALEAAVGHVPDGRIHDVDGSVGPPVVSPMAVIAWYPTRYDAAALFGPHPSDKEHDASKEESQFAVMSVFAGNDVIPGATTEDAAKLKVLLDDDPRVKDSLVKVFPEQEHGFAHIGLASNAAGVEDSTLDRFVDEEYGGAGQLSPCDGEAEVACLLSTAFMETYSRVFLPTAGAPIAEEEGGWSSELEMQDFSYASKRDIRKEIKESLDAFEGGLSGGQNVDLEDETRRKEMECLLRSMQEGTDPGSFTIEDGDDVETMYSKLKAANVDFELF